MRRTAAFAAITAAVLLAGCLMSGCSPGRVNFVKAAESNFDPYLQNPTEAQKQWMRDHYYRMRTYAGFFDSRVGWFPNAWAYQDSYAIYRGQEAGLESYILKDAQGNRLYIPFGCSGGTCPQYAADIGDPGWRALWIGWANDLAAKGYKGVFVDDVNMATNVGNGNGTFVRPFDKRTGQDMTDANWRRYMAEFMEQVRQQLPADFEVIQNSVYFHAPPTDPYVTRAIDAASSLEIERGFNDTGIRGGSGKFGFDTLLAWIDYAHSRGKPVIYDVNVDWGREYALACYFLSSNGFDGLGNDNGGLPDNWWSAGYDVDLGLPAGGRYLWNGVYRRDFELGIVLVNPPDSPTRTLTPGGTWRGLDGTTKTSVTLPAREGVVLLKP